MNILELEQPEASSLGGQTAINLAGPLTRRGVNHRNRHGRHQKAENRDAFEGARTAAHPAAARTGGHEHRGRRARRAEIGYPVLVRPSYVLGGRAMQIVAGEAALRTYLRNAVEINEDQPVLVDKYISGKELEVDAVCDGRDVFVPGIMELVERTGIHSGDSISVYPTFSVSPKVKGTILEYTKKLGLGIGIVGLYNIQFIVDKAENVYVIEVNPRSSRTVPFLSKATGYSLADIATMVILGKSLKEQGLFEIYPPERKYWYVKVPAFSFSKLSGMDNYLSPEMKSTGEAIGYDSSLTRALYKALIASGMKLANYGTLFVTIADGDKEEALPLIRRFYNMGFNIEATRGTARFLKEHGIRTRTKRKLSDGSDRDPREHPQGLRHLHHQYARVRRQQRGQRRLPDPPLRFGEQRHRVYRAGHRPRAARRARGDDHDDLHDRRRRTLRRGGHWPWNWIRRFAASCTKGKSCSGPARPSRDCTFSPATASGFPLASHGAALPCSGSFRWSLQARRSSFPYSAHSSSPRGCISCSDATSTRRGSRRARATPSPAGAC